MRVGIGLKSFEDPRRAHPPAHAHGHHSITRVPAFHLLEKCRCELRPGAAKRVAQRDRPPVHIYLFGIESERPDHRQSLRCKSLIQFDEANVFQRESSQLQNLGIA